MLHGDISSREAPRIAFDIDSVLFTDKPLRKSFISRVFSFLETPTEKYLNRELNTLNKSVIEYIWNKTQYSIYLVTFDCIELEELHSFLINKNIPYTNLDFFMEWDDVRYRLINGFFTYFFSANEELISYVGNGAKYIGNWRSVIK